MTTSERLFSGIELRTEGRRLMGEVMPYGDVSPSHRERFAPRSLHPSENVVLNLEHDEMRAVAWYPGGGLTLENDEQSLRMVAELPRIPAADRALEYVRAGEVSGLSVEFVAQSERRDEGIRVVEDAILKGVGLVRKPSYENALVEARKRLRTIRGRIPAKKALECRCSPGDCSEALFENGALDEVIDPDQQKDALAVLGEYANPLGSRKRKTLRFWSDREGGLQFALDVPDSPRGRALLESMDAADTFARPVLDLDASEFVIESGRATYSKARIRALTFGATDASEGWEPLRFKTSPGDDVPQTPKRQRARRWL